MDTLLGTLFIAVCFVVFLGSLLFSEYNNHRTTAAISYAGWDNLYKKKLNLNRAEKKLLNEISIRVGADPFYKIDFCMETALSLLLNVYRSIGVLPPTKQWFDIFQYCVMIYWMIC